MKLYILRDVVTNLKIRGMRRLGFLSLLTPSFTAPRSPPHRAVARPFPPGGERRRGGGHAAPHSAPLLNNVAVSHVAQTSVGADLGFHAGCHGLAFRQRPHQRVARRAFRQLQYEMRAARHGVARPCFAG